MGTPLLDEVFARPDEDGPRWRYAASLGDDPRGELIRLQLGPASAAAEKKAKALLKKHGALWLGPLATVLVARSVMWERGFPVGGALAIRVKPEEREAMIGLPEAATLRALDLAKPNAGPDPAWLRRFLFESPLRGLRELRGLYQQLAVELITSDPPWRLERLAFLEWGAGGLPATPAEVSAAFRDGRGLPALTELHLTFQAIGNDPPLYDWLASTEAGRRLRVLSMGVEADHAARWWPSVRAWGGACGLEAVRFSRVALERRARGWTLTGSVAGAPPYVVETLRAMDRADLDVAVEGL